MVETNDTPRESSYSPLISIVVCTYNRAKLLAGVLKTLCEQRFDASDYEVIVVDNNSIDDTLVTVESFCSQYANIQYYFEPHQGLSQARNRGWQEANGEYVALLNNDTVVEHDWLSSLVDRMQEGDLGQGSAFRLLASVLDGRRFSVAVDDTA